MNSLELLYNKILEYFLRESLKVSCDRGLKAPSLSKRAIGAKVPVVLESIDLTFAIEQLYRGIEFQSKDLGGSLALAKPLP
jgi:hypothetical protein